MKNKIFLFATILSVLSLVLTSCSDNTRYVQDEPQPTAVEGWDNGQKVVYVKDNNGQEFLMSYLLFTSLYNRGGYNNVVNHYYTHSSDRNYRPVSNSFRRSKTLNGFSNSYKNTSRTNRVYKPSTSTLNSFNSTKTKLYGSKFKPSRTTPSTYTKPKSNFYKSSSYKPSSSSYKPSRPSYSKSSSSFRRSSSFSRSRRR